MINDSNFNIYTEERLKYEYMFNMDCFDESNGMCCNNLAVKSLLIILCYINIIFQNIYL